MSDGELLTVALIWLVLANVAKSKRTEYAAIVGCVAALIVLGLRILS